MCKYQSVLSWTGSLCPNPKPGCGVVGEILFPANALEALGAAVCHISAHVAAGPKQCQLCPRPEVHWHWRGLSMALGSWLGHQRCLLLAQGLPGTAHKL